MSDMQEPQDVQVDDLPQHAHETAPNEHTHPVSDMGDDGQEATTQESPQTPEAPTWSQDDEDEARLFGWKSPDEWRGEVPKGYIDNPEDFLGRVRKSRIFTTMSDKVENTRAGLERVNQMALDRQKQQYEAELSRVRQARDDAFQSGDEEAYKRANTAEQGLLNAQPQVQSNQPDPVVESYVNSDKGAWLKNPILHKTAADLIEALPHVKAMPAAQQLDYAESEMRKMYPGYFPVPKPAPKPAPRQVVDGGGIGGGSAGRSAFDKLPGDAKSTFKRFVADGTFQDTAADRKEYADEYNGQ